MKMQASRTCGKKNAIGDCKTSCSNCCCHDLIILFASEYSCPDQTLYFINGKYMCVCGGGLLSGVYFFICLAFLCCSGVLLLSTEVLFFSEVSCVDLLTAFMLL